MVGHAVSNVVPVVAANRVGTEHGQTFYGTSFITNERGDILAELDREEEGVITATLDLALANARRTAAAVALPVSVDFEGGYAVDPDAVAANVEKLAATGAIGWEAILRLREPEPIAGVTVMVVAGIGILINGFTALLFARGRKDDINIEGAYLHMAADAGVSLGVVVAALLIMATGWQWIDPAISLVIAVVVLISGWELARDSVNLALDAVPKGIDLKQVRDYLAALEGVTEVHDLHIWAMSTSETALTAHLVRPGGHDDIFLHRVCAELSERFSIHHATLQVEISSETCRLAPAEMV